ncbi:MAG: tetratricopeptide repeat protein [Planctomycetota bacterium]
MKRTDRIPDAEGRQNALGGERSQLTPDFLCREAELRKLRALLNQTLMPGGADMAADLAELRALLPEESGGFAAEMPRSVVLLRGRSGAGKSRLLTQLKTHAESRGVLVREVHCFERQGIPFQPILRVAKELLNESPYRTIVWHKYATVLTRVFPELARELGAAPPQAELPGDDGKIQLFDALVRMLGDLAQDRALLLLVHDLHRSDRGTVDFLEYLGRNAYLDETLRRREPGLRPSASDETSWKQIRARDGKSLAYISDSLEAQSPTLDETTQRMMVVADYLERTESEPDARDEELVRWAVERLAALRAEPFVAHLTVPALSLDETHGLVQKILRARVAPEVAARIHAAAAGTPLTVVEICRVLSEEGGVVPSIDGAATGRANTETDRRYEISAQLLDEIFAEPRTVEVAPDGATPVSNLIDRLIDRRLRGLNELETQVVRVLAVLRRPVQIRFLENLLGSDDGSVGAALAELAARDFVREQRTEQVVRFYLGHEDYVRRVYGALDATQRQELHLAIGSTLAADIRAGDPVRTFEIYEHFRQSSAPHRAIEVGMTATYYFAEAYSPAIAARIGTDVLALLDGAEHLARRLELLLALSRLELRLGHVAVAKAHIKRHIAEGVAQTPEARLEAWYQLAEVYRRGGEAHKGIKVLNRALKLCAPCVTDLVRAQVAGKLARMRLDRQDPKRAINLSVAGLRQLEGATDARVVKVPLLEVLAEAHLAKAEYVSAIQHFQQLLELVEETGDEVRLAAVLNMLGRVYYDRGNYFRAARYLFRALDAIRKLQDQRALSRAYDMLGKVYRNSGDHVRGIEYFNRCLRLRERIGDQKGLSPTLNSQGSLYMHAGDYPKALRFFKLSVENSERFGDTAGLVRAFLHLGRAYFEIGELRQVDSLCKQILILSQEFNLLELEAEGHRLQADLMALRGDDKLVEREYRKAIEIAARRGKKICEAGATLGLGALLMEREQYEAALKLITKGQRIAEEVQRVPLQVQAFLLKGNIYRSLKGGNVDRAKESFRKGFELISGDPHLLMMWELDASISRIFQSNMEFVEAAESYRRAERILDRILEKLPDDMKVVFVDDRRRKSFYEDLRRFQKEAAGRTGNAINTESSNAVRGDRVWRVPAKALQDDENATLQADRCLDALARISTRQGSAVAWAEQLLEEARLILAAPSGCLVETGNSAEFGDPGKPRVLASCDLGLEVDWMATNKFIGALMRELPTSGAVLRSGNDGWTERLKSLPEGPLYKNRSLIAVPMLDGAQVVAILYLERPSAQNPFTADDQRLLERLLAAASGQFLSMRRQFAQSMVRDSSVYSRLGFCEQLPRVVRAARLAQRPICVVLVQALGIDELLSGRREFDPVVEELSQAGTIEPALVAYLSADTLCFVYDGPGLPPAEVLTSSVREDLEGIATRHLGGPLSACSLRAIDAAVELEDPEKLRRIVDGWISARPVLVLEGPTNGFDVSGEIAALTRGDLTLKEAKIALERRYIAAELQKSRGNITRAAESLGVHRPQLSNLIKKHNVRREEFGA